LASVTMAMTTLIEGDFIMKDEMMA
jgi:hypothetical protein